jgi:hypothetical protein
MKKITYLASALVFTLGFAACESEPVENNEAYETSFEESPEYIEDAERDNNLPIIGAGETEVGDVEYENEQTIFESEEVEADQEGETTEVEY